MRTTKLLIAATACGTLLTLNSTAQGAYFGIQAGYGFPAARQAAVSDYKSTASGSGLTAEYKSRSLSYGKGVNAGAYFGFMFNKNIGAELGLNYLMGSKNVFNSESVGITNTNTRETTEKGSMLRIIPALRMTTDEGSLRPYMKAGLIIGLAGKVTSDEHNETKSPAATNIDEESWEYKGGLGLGFHGALGINFMLNDQMGVFAELAGYYQSWAPKTGSMTKKTVNGVDQMGDLKTVSKEIEFTDSYTVSGTANDGAPRQDVKMYAPFSSFGINIGLHIALGGKKE